jgi:hypothetical protein
MANFAAMNLLDPVANMQNIFNRKGRKRSRKRREEASAA